jgi:hypothetical protein
MVRVGRSGETTGASGMLEAEDTTKDGGVEDEPLAMKLDGVPCPSVGRTTAPTLLVDEDCRL